MNVAQRLARLEAAVGRKGTYGHRNRVDLVALSDALVEEHVDPDEALDRGRVVVGGDQTRYIATLRALRRSTRRECQAPARLPRAWESTTRADALSPSTHPR